jgi:hypothetical protein
LIDPLCKFQSEDILWKPFQHYRWGAPNKQECAPFLTLLLPDGFLYRGLRMLLRIFFRYEFACDGAAIHFHFCGHVFLL